MALITKPDMEFIWASGGAIVEPSDVKKQTGWTPEVPPHQWENWIQNRQDNYLAHINQRGIPEWDGNTEYEAGGLSYVQGTNGVVYKSVAASGPATTVQDPTTDISDTYWAVAFAEPGDFITETDGDARYVQRSNNLSDLSNIPTAVTNLGLDNTVKAGIIGSASNLKSSATGTNSTVTVTADSLCLKNSVSEQIVLNGVSVTPSLAASGANGIDVGAGAYFDSTWYSVWVIWNETTSAVAGLFSLSFTSPIMPAGYTHKALVSVARSDSSGNKYPLSMVQAGDEFQYKVVAGTNVTILPGIASGTQGTVGSVGVIVPGISNLVPPNAVAIFTRSYVSPTSTLQLSPGPIMALAAGSPCFTVSTSTTNLNLDAEFIFESANQLYYAGNGSVPNCTAACRGFRINL